MNAPFLYLDNWEAPQPENRFDRAIHGSGLPVVRHHPARGDPAPFGAYCGVFVSASLAGAYDGAPWIEEQHGLLRALGETGTPMIGLCFGAQILASALVGRDQVVKRAEKEVGYHPVTLTDAAAGDALLDGLPSPSRTLHWHGDEVRAGHPDIRVLAASEACDNQVWRWAHGPVWGIQPHIEAGAPEARAWFATNRAGFERDGCDVDAMIVEAEDNTDLEPMIARFLDLARTRNTEGASK
ncbi:MAG: type 1 glutamine amidotransferase [Pseudomonadota bacterium]